LAFGWLRTYQLQEDGLDTVDANTTLGFDDDERDYGVAAECWKCLVAGVVHSPTIPPTRRAGEVWHRDHRTHADRSTDQLDNARCLTAKAVRAGHASHLVLSSARPPKAGNAWSVEHPQRFVG
jgi:hypothetical protein